MPTTEAQTSLCRLSRNAQIINSILSAEFYQNRPRDTKKKGASQFTTANEPIFTKLTLGTEGYEKKSYTEFHGSLRRSVSQSHTWLSYILGPPAPHITASWEVWVAGVSAAVCCSLFCGALSDAKGL